MSVATGLDRARSRALPALHGPQIAFQNAVNQLRQGDFAAAEGSARRALIADPLHYRHAGVLGLTQTALGDERAAVDAYALSAKLSWREPLTQAFLAQQAMQSGNWSEAAMRYDALARVDPRSLIARAAAQQLERSAAGRKALFDRVRSDPLWAGPFLEGEALDSEQFARRTERLAGQSLPLGCEKSTPGVERLVREGRHRLAARWWLLHCPAASRASPSSLAFEPSDNSPFRWRRIASGDVAIRQTGAGLVVRNSAPVPKTFLEKPVTMEPGQYRLRFAGQPIGLDVGFGCAREEATAETFAAQGEDIPVPNCRGQTLRVRVEGRGEAAFRGLTLVPAPEAPASQ